MLFDFHLSILRYKVGGDFYYRVTCTKMTGPPADPPAEPLMQQQLKGGHNFGAILLILTDWLSERVHEDV